MTSANIATLAPDTAYTGSIDNQGSEASYTHKQYSYCANSPVLLSAGTVQPILPTLQDGIEVANSNNAYVYSCPQSIDRQAVQFELWAALDGDSRSRKWQMTALGTINNILYQAVKCWGVLDKGQINRQSMLELCKTPVWLMTALCHTADVLSQYWPGSGNKHTVRTVIDDIKDIGLLDYHSEGGKGKQSRIYTHLDFVGLLLLAELLEKSLGYDSLPEHRGNCVRMLFNAVFPGWGYNREGDADAVEPTDHENSDEVRGWRDTALESAQSIYQRAFDAYHSIKGFFNRNDPVMVENRKDLQRLWISAGKPGELQW